MGLQCGGRKGIETSYDITVIKYLVSSKNIGCLVVALVSRS
jgi:hypothetical protein